MSRIRFALASVGLCMPSAKADMLAAGAASRRADRPLLQGGSSGRAGAAANRWRLGYTGAARPGAGQNVAITLRLTDHRKSLPGMAGFQPFDARRLRLTVRANGYPGTRLLPTICLRATREFPCSIPVMDERKSELGRITQRSYPLRQDISAREMIVSASIGARVGRRQ